MIGQSIVAVNDLGIFYAQALAKIAWAYTMAEIDAPFLFNERFAMHLSRSNHHLNLVNICFSFYLTSTSTVVCLS
jgi:hypothetical protein